MASAISDRFGRAIQYLRISLTDRCNLRCVYCMPEHGVPYEDADQVLSTAEILRLVHLLSAHGLSKVRITGGEPLVRGDEAVELIEHISRIPPIADIGLTTNGVLLTRYASRLRAAGLGRINISVDTLRPDRFVKIARFDKFEEVQAGLASAVDAGFAPIKLNMVVMRDVNDDEVCDLAELTRDHPFHVRYLEYMPIGQVTRWEWRSKFVGNDEVIERLGERYELEPIAMPCSSTARRYRVPGYAGFVEVISPISHRFCEGCNRLRLTANGCLAPCLSDNYEYDLRPVLRAGASDDELLACVREAVAHKPRQSDFEGRAERGGSIRIMAQIGG